jgi:hypothetical protein
MALEAGLAIARAGRGDEAAKAMKLGADLAFADPDLRRVASSTAYYLAGDAPRALDELGDDREDEDPADGPRTFAHRAAAVAQKAEILASLGKSKEAQTAALSADALAARARDKETARAIDVYARWTRLSLAQSSGHVLRETAPVRPGRFRSIGFAEITMAWAQPNAANEDAIADTLRAWATAVALPEEGRRAARYAAFHQRGDAPPGHLEHLALGAALMGPGEGDVELWLDVFDAVDARRMPLRSYAWYRAEAARWRGDSESAARWAGRYRTLATLAADPARAEIAAFLGI